MESVAIGMTATGTCCSALVLYAVVAYLRDLKVLKEQQRLQHLKMLRDKAVKLMEGSKQKAARATPESSGVLGEDSKSKENSKDCLNISKGTSSDDDLSRSKSGNESQLFDSGDFGFMKFKPKTFDTVVQEAKVKSSNTKLKMFNTFQYLRVYISILGAIYPIWYVLTYYTSYPEAHFLRNCQILTRIDNVLFVVFRSSVLMFYVLRLRIVQFAEPSFQYEFYGLVSGICIASICGMFQAVDITPFTYEQGCDYDVGLVGFAGYTIYMILSFAINIVLFIEFIKSIKTQQTFMRTSNSMASRGKASQFDGLIKRTRYGFFVYTFIALSADLMFTLIYNVYSDEVFSGANSAKLAFLPIICDILYYLDAVCGSLSVLSTHARFAQMLLFGLCCSKEKRALRPDLESGLPKTMISELREKQQALSK